MISQIDSMTSKIDKLFGSKTRVALLSKLMMNAGRTFYIRELSKELGIPYSMLYKEEKNLANLGIVNEEQKGKVTLVSVNRKLPYLAELKGLVTKTAGLADLLRDALSDFKGVRYALIYGSFATGEESESSDVDVLIVGDDDEAKLLKAISQIEEKASREVNYILWTDRDFRMRVRGKHHLLTEIGDKPIIMIIGEESEFRKAVKK